MKSVREAVLNCYCHRDLSLSADIRIFVLDNRIEVYSPGGAPEGLSIEEIKNGANAKRNPILVKALDKLEYIENYTSGIQRILGEYEGFPLQPEFYISDALFKVVLYNKNYYYDHKKQNKDKPGWPVNGTGNETVNGTGNETVNAIKNGIGNETANAILDLMRRDRNVTLAEIAELTSKGRSTVSRYIRELKDAGIIEHVGSDKVGHWKILR
jgi:predicted HTH transcriptional regulator